MKKFFMLLTIAILAIIALTLVACGPKGETEFQQALAACEYGVQSANVASGEVVCLECSSVCGEVEQVEVVEEGVLIDVFGPEQAFPGTVEGPAIAEVWDGGSYCALVKVNEDETLVWNNPGAWWQAGSQASLDLRFPHHRQEYEVKYADCGVLMSANDLP